MTITCINATFHDPPCLNIYTLPARIIDQAYMALVIGLTAFEVTTAVLILIVCSSLVCRVVRAVFWRPYATTKRFREQGVSGPPYTLLTGSLPFIKALMKEANELVLDTNSNDILYRVLPHYHTWSSQYGDMFLYWHGTEPLLCVSDLEMVKQILSSKFSFYDQPRPIPYLEYMAGQGVALVNGHDWVRQRRVMNPAFSIDKLEAMVKGIAECGERALEEWRKQASVAEDQAIELEMCGEFQKLTADIISHTAFGTSYVLGKEAFKAQKELQGLCAAASANLFIPGMQYLPTPYNIRLWRLDNKLKTFIRHIIQSRFQDSGCSSSTTSNSRNRFGDDLVGLLMESSEAPQVMKEEGLKLKLKLTMNEIVENCKTFFFAGHESTSNFLSWTMFLLSVHQDWQANLRQEVLRECGVATVPDADMLAKLKLVHMVLMEVLRLYCPVILLGKVASQEMELGNVRIPKGTNLIIPIIKIHRSREYWGEDANEFNPRRFANGMAKAASHPNALLPFSMGPRVCIGQDFAMLEAKTLLVLILRSFSFSLSPNYKHAPTDFIHLQPQFGLPVILKPLNF